jgi:integrase
VIGTYPTRADAVAALEKLSGQAVTGKYNQTFEQVYEMWKTEHFRDLTPSGQEGYELAYKRLAALQPRKLRDITTAEYQVEIDKQTRPSAEKSRQLISQLCKWSVREGITRLNCGQYLKLPPSEKTEKEIFNDIEIAKIQKAAENNEAAKLVCMLLATGMRIGELFSLRTEDVYEKYCIGGEKTEAGRNRIIPIRPEDRAYFKYFRAKGGVLLIDGYEGNRNVKNFRQRDYYTLLKDLGIDEKTPHATRHTYSSRAVREGMPREVLSKILGHASYETTANVYVHQDIDTLIKAVEC